VSYLDNSANKHVSDVAHVDKETDSGHLAVISSRPKQKIAASTEKADKLVSTRA